MVVSEVNILPVKPRNGLVGFASIVIDNNIYLGSIAIFSKIGGGHRVLYPIKKIGSGHINLFHPINRDTSRAIEAAIIDKYDQITKKGNEYDRHDKAVNSFF